MFDSPKISNYTTKANTTLRHLQQVKDKSLFCQETLTKFCIKLVCWGVWNGGSNWSVMLLSNDWFVRTEGQGGEDRGVLDPSDNKLKCILPLCSWKRGLVTSSQPCMSTSRGSKQKALSQSAVSNTGLLYAAHSVAVTAQFNELFRYFK